MSETTIRCASLPVADVVSGGTWEEFWRALRVACQESAYLANWAARKLWCAEPTQDADRIGPTPKTALYEFVRTAKPKRPAYPRRDYWQGAMKSAGCVLRFVQQRYAKKRIQCVARMEEQLPSYRREFPFPVHNQAWEASRDPASGAYLLAFPMGGIRWLVRLRSGAEFGRHLGHVRDVIAGKAKGGEMRLCIQRCGSQHYRKGEVRAAGGGQRESFRVMCRIAVRVDKAELKEQGHAAVVTTQPNALWVAEVTGQANTWNYNADHVRRWIAQHAARRQRFSEDMKPEVRWTKQVRRATNERLDKFCQKQRDRLNSAVQMAAAALAKWLVGRGVSSLIYDDGCKSYFPSFPWAALRERVRQKCEEAGIAFAGRSGGADEPAVVPA